MPISYPMPIWPRWLWSTPEVLKVGLTGGIASGKSVVGEMFAALGAHIIQADEISRQLMEPGEEVYREVVRHFGSGILNPDGSVNRTAQPMSARELLRPSRRSPRCRGP